MNNKYTNRVVYDNGQSLKQTNYVIEHYYVLANARGHTSLQKQWYTEQTVNGGAIYIYVYVYIFIIELPVCWRNYRATFCEQHACSPFVIYSICSLK